MPAERLARFVLLPELKLTKTVEEGTGYMALHVTKVSEMEVCPKCATPSRSVYDTRITSVKDQPLRNKRVRLVITKRRFRCRPCKRPFTEPVPGISKGRRYTERFRQHILWACDRFTDLKAVRQHVDASSGFIYKALYDRLELKRRMNHSYPWPRSIGIDEHRFRRATKESPTEFASIIVDHKNHKAFELVRGRAVLDLEASLSHITGAENVRFVTMDLSDTYRSFVKRNFRNAEIVADKFHVLRLLNPTLTRRRKEITGDHRRNPIRKLLLMRGDRLDFGTRSVVYRWLSEHQELAEIYRWKEALHRLYRTRGYSRAERALRKLCDAMASSRLPEVVTLRRTLLRWFREVLCYFKTGLTNGRVEGFNNKAKLIRKRAYGYRSFKNYRLRLLSACA